MTYSPSPLARRVVGILGTDYAVAALLTLTFLAVFLSTLCPTAYLGDSGEISTAIATGGIIHPPGYPLFSVLGRLALALIPQGEAAFRIGCVVAAAGAGAVGVLYLVCREVGGSRRAAASAAGLFGLCYSFWSQSVRVEVYSLNALLAGLAILFCLRYARRGDFASLAAAALSLTLGIAHHLTIVVLIPGLIVLCGVRLWTDKGFVGRLSATIGLLCIGPLSYLLLLFWARREPAENWGRPVTLPALWNHMSARIYQGHLRIPLGADLAHVVAGFGQLVADDFPFLMWVLVVVGGVVLWKRNRAAAVGLGIVALGATCYNFCYNIDDITGYYFAVWMVFAVCVSAALDAAYAFATARGSGRLLVSLFCLALPAAQFVRNERACDLSRATFVREFARMKLENCDRGGVLITQGDEDTFPLLYVHEVLRVRPDVLVLDRPMIDGMILDYDKEPSRWYLYQLKREGVPIPTEIPTDAASRDRLGHDGLLIGLLTGELAHRPLYATFMKTADAAKGPEVFLQWARQNANVLPQGIVLHLQPRDQRVDLPTLLERNRRIWDATELPDMNSLAIRADQDLDGDYLSDHCASMLVNYGFLYEMAHDPVHAEKVYAFATRWAPRNREAAQALTAVRARRGVGGKR